MSSGVGNTAFAGSLSSTKTSRTKKATKVTETTKSSKATKASKATATKDKYNEAIKEATKKEGLINTYKTSKGELYFEITPENFEHTYLLTNRMISTSSSAAFNAGQLLTDPIMFKIGADTSYVRFYNVSDYNRLRPGDEIEKAFNRNNLNPILKSFEVKAHKGDSLFLIDVTSFFRNDEKVISPLQFSSISGVKKSGRFDSDVAEIYEVKSFPENVEISSRMNFITEPHSYLVNLRRSILKLPEEPMKMRFKDNRVGYFESMYKYFDSSIDRVPTKNFIHRWRLEPKPEDMQKYFAGELVEPAKPIVYYVDSAFPNKYKEAVKNGIEDWQKAFETAGFKNAIIAKDYPSDSTDFDPDDIRYNCIRYMVTEIANAQGPSYVDPRSGEILVGEVNWYSNVNNLLNNWRFVQTGAVDPRVRKVVFDDALMTESIRYVASHEVGHTLGLMHNMGASFSYPVDSLRSPSFTQKYGTTPSIMDYARNNYVAQPGDLEKGVNLLPPLIGEYDKYAINWGYRLFPGDLTPEQEQDSLKNMIKEKADNPMCHFGAQQVFATLSPEDLMEDLGDDHIKASDYGIANLKRLIPNLESWFYEEGKDYMEIKIKYFNIARQYNRYLTHVYPYIGGLKFRDIYQGDGSNGVSREYVSKEEQKRAMKWLMDQILTYHDWMLPRRILDITEYGSGDLDGYPRALAAKLFGTTTFTIIAEGERSGQEGLYTLEDYINDAVDEAFRNVRKRSKLQHEDMSIQNAAIAQLCVLAGLASPKKDRTDLSTSTMLTNDEIEVIDEYNLANSELESQLRMASESLLPCMNIDRVANNLDVANSLTVANPAGALKAPNATKAPIEYFRANNNLPRLSGAHLRPLAYKQLKRIVAKYKKVKTSADSMSEAFYDYQIGRIERLMKK